MMKNFKKIVAAALIGGVIVSCPLHTRRADAMEWSEAAGLVFEIAIWTMPYWMSLITPAPVAAATEAIAANTKSNTGILSKIISLFK